MLVKKLLLLNVLVCLCFSLVLVAADNKTTPADLTAAQIVAKNVAARGGLQELGNEIRAAQVVSQLEAALSRGPADAGAVVEHIVCRVQHVAVARIVGRDVQRVSIDEKERSAAAILGPQRALHDPEGVLFCHVGNADAKDR